MHEPGRFVSTLPVLLAPLAGLLANGCAADRIDQSLPAIERPVPPLPTIQVEPSGFAGEDKIIEGLFPAELGAEVPIERFDALIEAAFENSGAFEVLRQQPGSAETDARYLLEFTIDEMRSDASKIGELATLMGQEKNEYLTVSINYRLINNASKQEIGAESDITDKYRVKHEESFILTNLQLKSYFEKTDKKYWAYVNGTIRAMVKLTSDVQDRVQAYEQEVDAGRADQG